MANAKALAAGIAKRGFRIVSGGTDNHLFLVDLYSRGLTGKDAQPALDRAGITVNKNSIPFDPTPPMTGGGIRLGSPAVTTRGMREPEMERIAGWIAEVLAHLGDAAARAARARRSGRFRRAVSALHAALAIAPALRRRAATPRAERAARRCAWPSISVAPATYGLGTYIRNIVNQLARIDDEHALPADRPAVATSLNSTRCPKISSCSNIRTSRARFAPTCTCRGCCASAAWTCCTCRGFMRRRWCRRAW